VHDAAQAAGIPVWCGGMLEAGIGRAHNIALPRSTLPNFVLPGDVSASKRYWKRDIIKPSAQRFGSLTMNTYAFASSALVLAPPAAGYYWGFDYLAPSSSAWVSLLYMALFPSLLCYLIYYYALSYIPATRISMFSYLQPLLATTMAIPLLGETLSVTLLSGGALILAGVALSERS
jgi:drug/metabolite transporter (DMT)-like permease